MVRKKEEKERSGREKIEEAAETLTIRVPKSRETLVMRLIALVFLLGGLSLLGSLFAGTFTTNMSSGSVLVRIGLGILVIGIAYGLLRQRRWSIVALGGLSLASIMNSPVLALILGGATAYAFVHRKHFRRWY